MSSILVTGDHFNLAAECNSRIAEMHHQLYVAIACLGILVAVLTVVASVPLFKVMGVGKDSRDKHFADHDGMQ
jgi:hypothetical protein